MVGYGFHFIPCHKLFKKKKLLLIIPIIKMKEHLDFVHSDFNTRNEI